MTSPFAVLPRTITTFQADEIVGRIYPHERGPRALALDDQGCDEELIGAGIDKTFPAANQAVQAGTDSPPELARPSCSKEPT